ncbi:MAG: ATP-binding protein [Holosporales bacterium]|nr:ATP-binding protein [Holosporales bacterium]
MTFKIITVDERLKTQTGVKMLVVGGFGIGKTSLLKTLDEPTLCIDLEAGLLAVQDWPGAAITVRTWPEAKDLACLIGGPNPALRSDQTYSARHFETLKATNSIDFTRVDAVIANGAPPQNRTCPIKASGSQLRPSASDLFWRTRHNQRKPFLAGIVKLCPSVALPLASPI